MMNDPRRLPEFRVDLERVPPGARAVRLDYPENLGLRTKLGGEPDWIQDDETPACEPCGDPMSFVAQIDSVEHDNPRNLLRQTHRSRRQYMFGDVGMIYVFYCFDCSQSASVVQGY